MNQLSHLSTYRDSSATGNRNSSEASAATISHRTLAHLNIGVFIQLRNLGATKQRICSVLNLNQDEYDYVCTLT